MENISVESLSERKKNQLPNNQDASYTNADFETAISQTGFGKFNLILIALAIPSGWSAMFDSTSMSYVLPVAHCDLDLNLEQRGMLNGITYLGMITSACVWGFLADTLGRKKLLIAGYTIDAICVVVAGLSQSFEMLLVAKYMTGFIINGPFAAMMSVLSEFHAAKFRAKILLILGVIFAVANMILPMLAWVVLPMNWDVTLLGGKFNLHSWNFYILISSIPSMISATGHIFLPESPKFLMTVGKNEEALRVFKKVYSVNTGNPPSSYPVKTLVDEIKEKTIGKHGGFVTANRSSAQALKEGWQQITPLFFPPHILNLILVCIMQMGFFAGHNTLRLWLPQIYTAINDFQILHPDRDASLCEMVTSITPRANVTLSECISEDSRDSVYINAIIVAAVSIIAYIMASVFVIKVGKKTIIVCAATIASVCGFSIYFAQNVETTTTLSAIYTALVGVCCNVQLTVAVDLFPTSLRTISVALILMIGRIGAMVGNLIFPMLLQAGCIQPFLLISIVVFICVILTFFVPKTDLKALE